MAEIIPIEWFLRSPSKSKSKSKKVELVTVEKSIVNNIKKNVKLIEELKDTYNEFSRETNLFELNKTLLNFTKKIKLDENKHRVSKEDREAMEKRIQVLLNRMVLEKREKYSKIYNSLNRELSIFIVENEIKRGKEAEKLGLIMAQNFLDLLLYSEILNSFYRVSVKNSDERKTKEELNEELKTLSLIEKLLKEKVIQIEKHLLVLIRRLITGGK